MRSIVALAAAAVAALHARHCAAKADLKTLENEQNLLLHNLQQTKLASAALKDQLDKLQHSTNSKSSTLNVSNIVVDNGEAPAPEATGTGSYSAPIIVMLPEEPSDREKLEYALTLRCLGQKGFNPFEKVHNSKLLEMSTIKGTTVKEIQREIAETEKELKETRAEKAALQASLDGLKHSSYADRTKRLQVQHNVKLVQHEVDVLETKLNRLQKRLKAAVLFSKPASSARDESDDSSEKKRGSRSSDGDGDGEEADDDEGGDLDEDMDDYDDYDD